MDLNLQKILVGQHVMAHKSSSTIFDKYVAIMKIFEYFVLHQTNERLKIQVTRKTTL